MKQYSNFFLLTYNPNQFRFAASLINYYHLNDNKNLIFCRKKIGHKSPAKRTLKDFNSTFFYIPHFSSKKRLAELCNLLIYICYVSFFLIRNNPKRCNLIMGNYLFNAQRSICNIFLNSLNKIYVTDEGTSTILLANRRKELIHLNSKLTWWNKLLKTGHPTKPLTFYTNFLINDNEIDKIDLIKDLYQDVKLKQIDRNIIIFIGTYLVESNLISKEYFELILKKLHTQNEGKKIVYIPHHNESYIYTSKAVDVYNLTILKLNKTIEDYLIESETIPGVIASLTSTGFLYSSLILGNKVAYQNYIIDPSELPVKDKKGYENLYNLFDFQLKHLDYLKIHVESY